jgi:hypothetical protein
VVFRVHVFLVSRGIVSMDCMVVFQVQNSIVFLVLFSSMVCYVFLFLNRSSREPFFLCFD